MDTYVSLRRNTFAPPSEYIRTVHFNQDHYGPVSGGGAEAGVKVDQEVVVAVRLGIGGDNGGVLGVGTYGRGRGD